MADQKPAPIIPLPPPRVSDAKKRAQGSQAAVPDQTVVAQIPISVYAEWDKNGQIRSILAQHDLGNFQQPAILCDALYRDDRIYGVVTTRTGALTSTPIAAKPSQPSALAQEIADEVGGSEEEPGIWHTMFAPETVEQIDADGIMLGIGVGELVWDTSDPKRWVVRLKRWHPQFVYWDWGTYSYKLITGSGVITLPNTDENPRGDGKWFVHTPYGYQYGWLRALIRPLAALYLGRQWDWRDWFRQNEANGGPLTKVYVPEGADEDEKDEFFNDVADRNANTAVMVPVTSDGKEAGYDVDYTEATARTWESFKDLMAELNSSVAITVNGQDLSTEAAPTGLNSGVANLQGQVRIDKRRQDARIVPVLREQALTWWAQYNYGDPALAPRMVAEVDPPADELAEATALKTFGEAMKALEDGQVDVDVRTIADEWGIPQLTEEEVAKRDADAAAEAAEAFEQQRQLAAARGTQGPPRGPADGPPPKPKADEAALAMLGINHPTPAPVKRYEFAGLPIAVENTKGSRRFWYDAGASTPRGSTEMQHDYGFVEGHTGADGEDLDVYIGPDETATAVYVVHQLDAGSGYKRYDEDKVFLGFPSADAARAAYIAHRNDGEQAIQGMSVMPLERFKAKLKRRSGSGRITASSRLAAYVDEREADDAGDATLVAIARLTERAQLKTARTVAGKRRQALYADRLMMNARKLAARAVQVDLVALRGEIEAATSLEDLRRRVVRLYKDKMSPERLAKVVMKANMMAHLAGRLGAVKSL